MDLSFSTRSVREWTVMDVTGEVDISTAQQVRQQIGDLVDANQVDLVVNLLGVGFIDSSGLGVLVGGLKRVKERDGSMRLVVSGGPVERVLTITGLHQVFSVFGTVEEATS